MTLQVNLSHEQSLELGYYLSSFASVSVRSGEYIPDVLFSIIGQLTVDSRAYYDNLEKKSDEGCKESVSD